MQEATLDGREEIVLAATRIRVERLVEGATVAVSRIASFGRVIGASVAMRRIYPTLTRLAASNVAVLIEGEAGTLIIDEPSQLPPAARSKLARYLEASRAARRLSVELRFWRS